MPVNNKSHLSSSLESLRLFNTLILFVLLFALSGCSDSGYGEGNLDQEAMDYHKPVSVDATWGTTCALIKSGIVKCWGFGYWGQLGNTSANSFQMFPITVSGITTATSVLAGSTHTCAVLSDGTVKCWGNHDHGRLGIGISTSNKNTPETVKNIRTATSVSAGWTHTCALLSDGSIKCWGESRYGSLGNGIVGVNFWAPDSVKGLID